MLFQSQWNSSRDGFSLLVPPEHQPEHRLFHYTCKSTVVQCNVTDPTQVAASISSHQWVAHASCHSSQTGECSFVFTEKSTKTSGNHWFANKCCAIPLSQVVVTLHNGSFNIAAERQYMQLIQTKQYQHCSSIYLVHNNISTWHARVYPHIQEGQAQNNIQASCINGS